MRRQSCVFQFANRRLNLQFFASSDLDGARDCFRVSVLRDKLRGASGPIPAFANTDGTSGYFDNPVATSHRNGLPQDQWLSIGFRGARAERTETIATRLLPALFSSSTGFPLPPAGSKGDLSAPCL